VTAASTSSAGRADEVRTGHHFRDVVLGAPAIVSLIVLGAAAAVGGAIALGPAGGAGGFAAVLLLWLLVCTLLAGARARAEFFAGYAAERDLAWSRKAQIPGDTPLLRMGDERRADELLTGNLPGGLQGAVALYTYEKHHRGSDGSKTTEYHHFTLVHCALPESTERIPALYCQRRFGFHFLDGAEDVFRSTKRVELESARLDDRCEIFAGPAVDDVWLRRLFSPSFVSFLAEDTPEGFAFEVENGTLCVNVRRHHKTAAGLDDLCVNAERVAKRIRDELAE
jgi:hypothetical protein